MYAKSFVTNRKFELNVEAFARIAEDAWRRRLFHADCCVWFVMFCHAVLNFTLPDSHSHQLFSEKTCVHRVEIIWDSIHDATMFFYLVFTHLLCPVHMWNNVMKSKYISVECPTNETSTLSGNCSLFIPSKQVNAYQRILTLTWTSQMTVYTLYIYRYGSGCCTHLVCASCLWITNGCDPA
jgi:hypothetical protein